MVGLNQRRGYLLLNAGGWLLFGVAMMIGMLDVYPWDVVLATTPVYILIGFLTSLLLGLVYDRIGLGPGSFGRALAVIVVASYAAGALWIVAFYLYRHYGAAAVHSLSVQPSSLKLTRASTLLASPFSPSAPGSWVKLRPPLSE